MYVVTDGGCGTRAEAGGRIGGVNGMKKAIWIMAGVCCIVIPSVYCMVVTDFNLRQIGRNTGILCVSLIMLPSLSLVAKEIVDWRRGVDPYDTRPMPSRPSQVPLARPWKVSPPPAPPMPKRMMRGTELPGPVEGETSPYLTEDGQLKPGLMPPSRR